MSASTQFRAGASSSARATPTVLAGDAHREPARVFEGDSLNPESDESDAEDSEEEGEEELVDFLVDENARLTAELKELRESLSETIPAASSSTTAPPIPPASKPTTATPPRTADAAPPSTSAPAPSTSYTHATVLKSLTSLSAQELKRLANEASEFDKKKAVHAKYLADKKRILPRIVAGDIEAIADECRMEWLTFHPEVDSARPLGGILLGGPEDTLKKPIDEAEGICKGPDGQDYYPIDTGGPQIMRQSSADFDESTTILGDRMKEIVPRAALLVLMTPTSRQMGEVAFLTHLRPALALGMTVLILIKESEIDTGALARWRAYEEVAPRPGCIQFAFIRAPDNGRGNDLHDKEWMWVDGRTGSVVFEVGSPNLNDAGQGGLASLARTRKELAARLRSEESVIRVAFVRWSNGKGSGARELQRMGKYLMDLASDGRILYPTSALVDPRAAGPQLISILRSEFFHKAQTFLNDALVRSERGPLRKKASNRYAASTAKSHKNYDEEAPINTHLKLATIEKNAVVLAGAVQVARGAGNPEVPAILEQRKRFRNQVIDTITESISANPESASLLRSQDSIPDSATIFAKTRRPNVHRSLLAVAQYQNLSHDQTYEEITCSICDHVAYGVRDWTRHLLAHACGRGKSTKKIMKDGDFDCPNCQSSFETAIAGDFHVKLTAYWKLHGRDRTLEEECQHVRNRRGM